MKHFFPESLKTEGEVIASWGEAKLVKTLDVKYGLVGGTKEDLKAAREWIAIFLPDKIIRERGGRGGW